MNRLKVNLYSFGRESFDDEVRELLHELRQRGKVQGNQGNSLLAQFLFLTEKSAPELEAELREHGFTREQGLSVNPYVEDHELEGQ